MVTSKKGRHSGQKKPFKLEDIWHIRTRLEIEGSIRDLAPIRCGEPKPPESMLGLKHSSCSIVIRSCQIRQHYPLSWGRARRCIKDR